jgi:glutamate dehydrogenase (NAD(P)+)
VTGKPVNLGGSRGRESATGLGVFFVTRRACRDFGISLQGGRVVIQGFGNVGSWTAKYLHEAGSKVIAVADVDGGVRNDRGLDIPALLTWAKEKKTVQGFPGGDAWSKDRIFEVPCDVLIPAAMNGVLTDNNVAGVDTKIVIEAANNPINPHADHILAEKKIPVVPDILANAGGVTVSYFEWTQNLQQFYWEEAEVQKKLEGVMDRAYADVAEIAKKRNVPLRTAAFMVAIQRVYEAVQLRGI